MTALDVIDKMIDEYLGAGIQQAVLVQARARIIDEQRDLSSQGPFHTGESEDDDGVVTVLDSRGNAMTADEIVAALNTLTPSETLSTNAAPQAVESQTACTASASAANPADAAPFSSDKYGEWNPQRLNDWREAVKRQFVNDAAVDAIFDLALKGLTPSHVGQDSALADEIERAVAEVPSDDVAARKFLSFYSRVIDALRSSLSSTPRELPDAYMVAASGPKGELAATVWIRLADAEQDAYEWRINGKETEIIPLYQAPSATTRGSCCGSPDDCLWGGTACRNATERTINQEQT
jgi:hypothetical protein